MFQLVGDVIGVFVYSHALSETPSREDVSVSRAVLYKHSLIHVAAMHCKDIALIEPQDTGINYNKHVT